jgi:hypothetical protein
MELYIQIRDGQPYEHPILGDNFREAFPQIDPDNLPSEFARFERIQAPAPNTYEVVEGPVYQWVGNIVKDVWTVRPMTDEERTIKVEELTQGAYAFRDSLLAFASNQFAEATTDEQRQAWTEFSNALSSWVLVNPETPAFPTPPRIAEDGTVLSANASGSVPNVIG